MNPSTVPQQPQDDPNAIAQLLEVAREFAEPYRYEADNDQIFTASRFDINLVTTHTRDGYGWSLIAYLHVWGHQLMRVVTVTCAPGSPMATVDGINPATAHLLSDLACTMAYHTNSRDGKAAA